MVADRFRQAVHRLASPTLALLLLSLPSGVMAQNLPLDEASRAKIMREARDRLMRPSKGAAWEGQEVEVLRKQILELAGPCDPSTALCSMKRLGCALGVGSNLWKNKHFPGLMRFLALMRSLEDSWSVQLLPREVQVAYYFFRQNLHDPTDLQAFVSAPSDSYYELLLSFETVDADLASQGWPAGELCPGFGLTGLAKGEGDQAVRLSLQASAAYERQDYKEAERLYDQSLLLHQAKGDQPHIAAVLTALGAVAHARSDLVKAEGFYRRALEISARLHRPDLSVDPLWNLSSIAGIRGNLHAAEDLGVKALTIDEARGNSKEAGEKLLALTQIAGQRGDLEAATGYALRATRIYDALPMKAEQATAHRSLGAVYGDRKLWTQACVELGRSLALYQQLGAPETARIADVQRDIGCGPYADVHRFREADAAADKAFALGEYEKAEMEFEKGLPSAQIAYEHGSLSRDEMALIHGNHSWYLFFARKFDAAGRAAQQGLALNRNLVSLQTNHAHALMFQGRRDEALALYARYAGQSLEDGQRWETVIAADFARFRKAGMDDPLMQVVLDRFSKSFPHP